MHSLLQELEFNSTKEILPKIPTWTRSSQLVTLRDTWLFWEGTRTVIGLTLKQKDDETSLLNQLHSFIILSRTTWSVSLLAVCSCVIKWALEDSCCKVLMSCDVLPELCSYRPKSVRELLKDQQPQLFFLHQTPNQKQKGRNKQMV